MAINYPYLPEGYTIEYVGLDNPWMAAAKEFARLNSTDRQMPTGCIIVKDENIVASGANRSPLKNPFLANIHRKYFCPRRILGIASGTKYWLCPGCATNKHHAESRASRNVREQGGDAEGADAYLWGHWWACKQCWDSLIGVGIRRLYCLESSDILFNPAKPGNIVGEQFD